MTTCITIVITAILSLNPSWNDEKAKRFAKPICYESLSIRVDPLITVAIIHHESGWSTSSTMHNRNGSIDFGIMQFNCKLDLDSIYLKWRKWWCHPKRRKLLRSINGGIKAGVRELKFWRDLCFSRHKNSNLYGINLFYIKNYIDYFFNIIEISYNGINSSFNGLVAVGSDLSELSSYNYVNSLRQKALKKILKNHWWIQHYNWNSRFYSKRIMYVYFALLKNRDDIYDIVRLRRYTHFKDLNKCLKDKDLCLKEYRLWQRKKQNQKAYSKANKQLMK